MCAQPSPLDRVLGDLGCGVNEVSRAWVPSFPPRGSGRSHGPETGLTV